MKERLNRKKQIAKFLVIVMIISACPVFNNQNVKAAGAPSGIAGNGTGGVYIDINASPYTDFAQINNWGQYAYGTQGCAWFASARVSQLTGVNCTIYSGKSWYNSAYSKFGFTRGREFKGPALACYEGHVSVVESVSGTTAVVSEGGYTLGSAANGYCIIHTLSKSTLESNRGGNFLGYVYLPGSSPSPSGLSYTEIKTEFVDTWNAGLYGYIDNPGKIQLSAVGAYVWDEAGTLVVNHREECTLSTSYVNQQLNIVGEALPTGLRSGASYTYQLYAVANGTEYKSAVGSFTVLDDQKPEITNVIISDQSETGYTVSCKVTDNYQVDRVQFPTWTEANGQDDIAADWGSNSLVKGTKNGDTYTFQVKISDHNNEKGVYCTHIYAYDKAGNSICVPVEDVIIAEEVEISPTPTVSTQKPDNEIKDGVYTWQGRFTGWGGPESYPSSASHVQGDGKNNIYYINTTNIGFTSGYGCGLELMNPYSPYLYGADNEMAQFIKKMKNPRIKVILENGGTASSWNWDTELSFPSGKEMSLPSGYLDTGYFALFGNDDVITEVEIYDVGEKGNQPVVTANPTETSKPGNTTNPGISDNYTGQEAIYHNNLSIYQNQRSDKRMMEYLLMEPDNVYAYLINDEIREVCREITANCKTDMEKLQAIHDWVCNNLYYENSDNHGEGTGVGAIWVFYHRGTRCEGYADLTAAMCREVGIPCKEMWGTAVPANIDGLTIQEIKELASNNSYLKHAWNEAWVDGRWVLLDTTWDSQNYSKTSDADVVYQPCKQTYFDMSLEEFSKTHIFDEYISLFEYLFDEWNQKTAGTNATPTNAPTGSPSPNLTGNSSGSSGSKVKSPSSGSASGINQKHSLIQKPGKVTIKKVKKDGLGCAKITWKKVKCNEGYQIQYSRSRSFSSKKTKTSFSKSTYILGKSKKTYYIRVRAVNSGWTSQTQYGNKYGRWSKVRKIRMK